MKPAAGAAGAAPGAGAAGDGVKGAFVADLTPEMTVTAAFLVLRKDLRQKQNGDAYLSLTLGDRSGQIDAAMWERVAEAQALFERDDFVRVRGYVSVYRDKPQIKIERLRRLEAGEIDIADFLPTTRADVGRLWAEVEQRIAAMDDPHLRALLGAIFGDAEIAARFRRAPAAKTLHHAYLGGLLEHVCSLTGLADAVLRHYPSLNRDLVMTGILLHDLGKIQELGYERSFHYTTEGELLGHMILVLEIVHRKLAALPDFPRPLQAAVEHLIISHHGRYEFGSPKLPMFPEALLLHHLDDLDSKMNAMQRQLDEEGGEGEWTGYNRSLERPLLRLEEWLKPAAAATAPSGKGSPAGQAAGLERRLRGERP